MVRWTALAFALPLLAATPAAAQRADESDPALTSLKRFVGDEPITVQRRGLSFPVIEYREPDGTLTVRKGVIASKKIAPDTLLGVGLFEFEPKVRPGYSPDQAVGAPAKRKRRAAIGLTFKF